MRSLTRGRRCSNQVLSPSTSSATSQIGDRRLQCTQRGKHPCDRARPGIRIVGEGPHGARRYGTRSPRLEESEIAFFIGRNLPERMKRTMRGFLHLTERDKTNVVMLAHFFERPTNTHVTRLSLAAVGRPFKGCDGGGHWKAPGDCMTLSRVRCVISTIFLMVRYPVLALCIQRTNDRRGSRQLTSFF